MSGPAPVPGWVRVLGPWRVGGPAAQRLGLLFVLILVWDLVLLVDGHIPPGWSGAVVWGTVVLYPVLALACALALGQPPPARLLRWRPERLLVAAPAVAVLTVLVVAAQVPRLVRPGVPLSDDVTASTICAARDVLAGRDPYRTGEIACLDRLRAGVGLATPLERGPLRGRLRYPGPRALRMAARLARRGVRPTAFPTFGYPPLSFVWMLPVARAGHTAWVAWTLAAAAVWLLACGLAAGALWPAVLMLLMLQFGGGSVLGAATQGDGEFFAYALAILSLLWIDRGRWSAVLLAGAVATNPLTWVVVPGYAVLLAGLPGRRQRLLWFVGALVVAVGPWLLIYRDAGPEILALLRQPAYAYGIGLVAELGAAPAAVLRTVLLAAEGGGVALLALVCARWRRWVAAAPAVAVALFWVSWRSDANYLAQLFPLAVATAVGLHRLRAPSVSAVRSITPPVGA